MAKTSSQREIKSWKKWTSIEEKAQNRILEKKKAPFYGCFIFFNQYIDKSEIFQYIYYISVEAGTSRIRITDD